MIDGIDDTKISEAYNKLRDIRKKVKNKKILENLIKLTNLPCVEGIYFQSSIFVVLYSRKKIKNLEFENKAILDVKNNIENISNNMYMLKTYSVESYIDPIYFFPSEQYYMNKTVDSAVAIFESQAAALIRKKKK